MTLAQTRKIVRYVGSCPEHPHWATPSYFDRERIDALVHEHNESEHQGTETRD